MVAMVAAAGKVIAQCDENMNTLLAFRYQRRFSAGNGRNGASALKHGADGEDVLIQDAGRDAGVGCGLASTLG